MSEKIFVTAAEAADMLGGISVAFVYKLVKQNRLQHLKIGRRVVIPITAINALVQDDTKEI